MKNSSNILQKKDSAGFNFTPSDRCFSKADISMHAKVPKHPFNCKLSNIQPFQGLICHYSPILFSYVNNDVDCQRTIHTRKESRGFLFFIIINFFKQYIC